MAEHLRRMKGSIKAGMNPASFLESKNNWSVLFMMNCVLLFVPEVFMENDQRAYLSTYNKEKLMYETINLLHI